MGKIFGTDGVRGVANKELTGELAYKLGRAGAYYLTEEYQGSAKPVMLIGKDTRISGDMLETALIAGITSAGIDVVRLGIISTPGVAYLTKTLEAQGSVMISASHNPIADNGIKFFTGKGFKLTDKMENGIEDLLFNKYQQIPYPTHENIGITKTDDSLIQRYINHLMESVDVDFSGLRIVLDCANGAAYKIAPEVFRNLDADLIVINGRPDGDKINVNSGSTHPEIIQEKVKETNADLGIALDGDADRIIMVDNEGSVVDGDKIMAVLALDFKRRNCLDGNTLVTTAYSNMGLREALNGDGIDTAFAKNGDRYVLQEMIANNYNLGGEKSGHIIILDYNYTGDGVLTGLQMAQVVKKNCEPLKKLASIMEPWPQRLSAVKVKNKREWKENKKIKEVISRAEADLGEQGRVFVRASGTEPVIRIMLEGKDIKMLEKWDQRLKLIISEELN